MKKNDDFIISTITRKIYKIELLIPIIIFSLLSLIVIFFAKPATPDDESARFFISGFFILFTIFFGYIFYDTNKKMQYALYIKENGNQYQGKVINAQKRYARTYDGYSKEYIDLLVEFKEKFDNKYIVALAFPYQLKLTENLNELKFSNIYYKTNEESRLIYTQYMSKGYITFDNHDNLGKEFIYRGDNIKNYLGNDLSCTVFELDNKYVVDDFVGYN